MKAVWTAFGTLSRREGGVAAALLSILGITAAVESANGRSLLCRCGFVRLWAGKVNGPENSQQLADWYSLSHIVHGLIFYAVTRLALPHAKSGTRLVVAAMAEAAWEMLENSPVIIARYRAETVSLGYAGDSILNSLGDIAFMMLGFLLAARLPAWLSIALAIGLELVALAAIRDNLTLNVLMLIHPIHAVRIWQAG